MKLVRWLFSSAAPWWLRMLRTLLLAYLGLLIVLKVFENRFVYPKNNLAPKAIYYQSGKRNLNTSIYNDYLKSQKEENSNDNQFQIDKLRLEHASEREHQLYLASQKQKRGKDGFFPQRKHSKARNG